MDKRIERAKELFRALEEGSLGRASEIARRAFCIQEKLSEKSS
jgi:hypothetical protein